MSDTIDVNGKSSAPSPDDARAEAENLVEVSPDRLLEFAAQALSTFMQENDAEALNTLRPLNAAELRALRALAGRLEKACSILVYAAEREEKMAAVRQRLKQRGQLNPPPTGGS